MAINGLNLPLLGMGTCYMGERPEAAEDETGALLRGLSRGMRLADTAEMYGDGGSERLIGDIFRRRLARREDVAVMTKVLPENSAPPALFESCDRSLARLGTDYIDAYLLHWRTGRVRLAETVRGMEALVRCGKILRWGVSNFDTADMCELFALPGGQNCAVNQVMYNLGSRGIEYDLLPWMRARGVAPVAYCPLAQGGRLARMGRKFEASAALAATAKKYGATIYQMMLAFVLRGGDICAIPKAASAAHVDENAAAPALARAVSPEDWAALDAAFPPPTAKMHLDME